MKFIFFSVLLFSLDGLLKFNYIGDIMNVTNQIPERKGLLNIGVNEEVEFTLSVPNINKFGKKQFSGFVNGEHYYLPTHQQLTDALEQIPKGSKVKAKRLTKGGPKLACEYEVKNLDAKKENDIAPKSDKSDAILGTIVSCLKNNCSAPQTMIILKKEYKKEDLKKVGL